MESLARQEVWFLKGSRADFEGQRCLNCGHNIISRSERILLSTHHAYAAMALSLSPSPPNCLQASQVNDAKKYVVTEVRVRVLAVNNHPPHFGKPQYQAFVHEDESMAALVVTYSGRVLSLNVADMDFAGVSHLWRPACRKRGSNPCLHVFRACVYWWSAAVRPVKHILPTAAVRFSRVPPSFMSYCLLPQLAVLSPLHCMLPFSSGLDTICLSHSKHVHASTRSRQHRGVDKTPS